MHTNRDDYGATVCPVGICACMFTRLYGNYGGLSEHASYISVLQAYNFSLYSLAHADLSLVDRF